MDYTAEIFDQIQLLFAITGFNDHQLHCVLRFGAKLDATALEKAVACSIEAIPILGTRYIDGGKPHWASIDPDNFGKAFSITQTEIECQISCRYRVIEGNHSPYTALSIGNHLSGFYSR